MAFDFGLKDKLLRAVKSKLFWASVAVAVGAYLQSDNLGALIDTILKALSAA